MKNGQMEINGYILIGGKSSRMGEDKFALRLGDKSLLQIAIHNLSNAGIKNTKLIGNIEKSPAPAIEVIQDAYKNRGPLGGIHAALANSQSKLCFILACDYPFISPELIKFLSKVAFAESDFDAYIPTQKNGWIQPLCAFYRGENCLEILKEMLKDGLNYSVRDFLERIKTRFIEYGEFESLKNSENFFFNLNTKEDFERAKEIAKDKP